MYPAAPGSAIDGFVLQNGGSAVFAPAAVWLVSGTSGNAARNNIIENNTTGVFLANANERGHRRQR